jgi:hypothetical protein
MGVRGEVFFFFFILPNRTYFFNVKENRMGDLYLNIVESKNRDNGGFERQSVILFADDLQEFLKGFDESLKVLEKAVREKKHSGKAAVKREEDHDREKRHPNSFKEKSAGNRRSERGESRFKPAGEKSAGNRSGERGERSRFKPAGEKSAGSRSGERGEKSRFKPAGEKSARSRSGERAERERFQPAGEKNFRNRGGERGSESGSRDSKRVVVKRREQKPDNR